MRKISASEFLPMIKKNPSIFEHWNTPLEITEYIACTKFSITHLSKHLLFSGKNRMGESASFSLCKSLKIATGTFQNYVYFGHSGIEKIEDLHILQTDPKGHAVSFAGCPNLKIATGNYPGCVNFSGSEIHSIHNLQIEKPNTSGDYARFWNCPNLHTLNGWDLSKQIHIEPEKLESEINRRASLKNFIQETIPKELPFL
jgi:hypothetical protein